jgi:circadian clock protein KaiC
LRVGRFLRAAGVSTILVNEVHNITGDFQATEERTSNLADNIVFLRHVEYGGEMRKVIGALKMRTSDFEHTLRELEITADGISVGDPLPQLRGILTGTPEWESAPDEHGAS